MRHGICRLLSACLALLLLCAVPLLSACALGGTGSDGGSSKDPTPLPTPVLSIDENGVVSWEPIDGTYRYRYALDGGYIWKVTQECSVTLEYGETVWVYAEPHRGSLAVGNYCDSGIASIRRYLPTNDVTTEADFEIDLGTDDYYIDSLVTNLRGESTRVRLARRGDSYLVSRRQVNPATDEMAWYTVAYCKQTDGTYLAYGRYEVDDPRHEEENAWSEGRLDFDDETAAAFPFAFSFSDYLCLGYGAAIYQQWQERLNAEDGGSAYLSVGELTTLPKSDRAALYYEYWIDEGSYAYRAATFYIDPETHVCLLYEEDNPVGGRCLEFRMGAPAWETDEDLPRWPTLSNT